MKQETTGAAVQKKMISTSLRGGGDMTTLKILNSKERTALWGRLVRGRLCDLDLSAENLRTKLAEIGHPVTIQAIHKWLRGAGAPNLVNQEAIAEVLNCSPTLLFPTRSPR